MNVADAKGDFVVRDLRRSIVVDLGRESLRDIVLCANQLPRAVDRTLNEVEQTVDGLSRALTMSATWSVRRVGPVDSLHETPTASKARAPSRTGFMSRREMNLHSEGKGTGKGENGTRHVLRCAGPPSPIPLPPSPQGTGAGFEANSFVSR